MELLLKHECKQGCVITGRLDEFLVDKTSDEVLLSSVVAWQGYLYAQTMVPAKMLEFSLDPKVCC